MNTAQDATTVLLSQCTPQAWRNGGGTTREMLAWNGREPLASAAAQWLLRVSVADIDADGPFSRFEGIDRRFAVLEGEGVELIIAGRERIIQRGDPPTAFAGEVEVGCRLLSGSTRDLNLMVRRSAGSAVMSRAIPGSGFGAGLSWRAVFTFSPARLACAPDDTPVDLPAGSLFWSARAQPSWHLLEGEHAFWLGLRAPPVASRLRAPGTR